MTGALDVIQRAYQRKEDGEQGIEFTLKRGGGRIKARIREAGTPGYWEAYREELPPGFDPGRVTDELDRETVKLVTANYLLASLSVDGEFVDPGQAFELLVNPSNWELAQEIRIIANKPENFLKYPDMGKPLPPSLETESDGESGTLPKVVGQT